MKYKNKRKLEKLSIKLNTFIMDIVCYPVNKLEKVIKSKIRAYKNQTHPNIYEYMRL